MRILAHVVEGVGALAGHQGLVGATGSQLFFTEPGHRAQSQLLKSLAFDSQPIAPAFFADINVVDEAPPVEIRCRTQRVTAALPDQGLKPADIAQDHRGIQRYELAMALKSFMAQNLA